MTTSSGWARLSPVPVAMPDCAACVDLPRLAASIHADFHRAAPQPETWAPRFWSVISKNQPLDLDTGTRLILIDLDHRSFRDHGGFDAATWLFRVLDGPRAGQRVSATTGAAWESAVLGAAPEDLYPECLRPDRGPG